MPEQFLPQGIRSSAVRRTLCLRRLVGQPAGWRAHHAGTVSAARTRVPDPERTRSASRPWTNCSFSGRTGAQAGNHRRGIQRAAAVRSRIDAHRHHAQPARHLYAGYMPLKCCRCLRTADPARSSRVEPPSRPGSRTCWLRNLFKITAEQLAPAPRTRKANAGPRIPRTLRRRTRAAIYSHDASRRDRSRSTVIAKHIVVREIARPMPPTSPPRRVRRRHGP